MNWQPRRSIQSASPEAPPKSMPKAIWNVLCARGIVNTQDVENLLEPRLKNLAHPMSLDDMDKAVERLVAAYKNRERVGIYGDYDLDGTPGVALLYEGLKGLGFVTPAFRQPRRLTDGYGLHQHLIKELYSENASLLLTVDVGITDVESVAFANSLGMDVIITDHHLPKDQLPNALAIINPNKGTCGSGLTYLAGTGVAFYLILALRSRMQELGLLQSEFNPKSLLDLFALATVADMVPLVKENRALVKHGLLELKKTSRPGLRRLLGEIGILGKNISSTDIGFKVAPKLNALSRLDEGVLPLHVLLATDDTAPRVVEEALLINARRHEYQKRTEDTILQSLSGEFSEPFLFFVSEKFHPGVISVVANQLMERFKVPVFLGAALDDGRVVGSARSPGTQFHLPTVLESVQSELHRFGGHALAAGFETSRENEMNLRRKLENYFAELSSDSAVPLENYYDTDIEFAEINEGLMRWHDLLEPFGQGFPTPVFRLKSALVKQVKKLKKGHLKYQFTDGNSRQVLEGPWFSAREEYAVGQPVDVYFELSRNEFMGNVSIQMMIKDMVAAP